MLRTYGKTLVAIAIAVITAVQAAVSDHHLSTVEDVQIAIAFFTAIGVYLVPVVPSFPWVKTAIGAVLAVLNLLTSLIIGGISPSDWSALILAALTVLGVGVAPAVSKTAPPTVAQP